MDHPGKEKASDNFRLLEPFDAIRCGSGVEGSWAPGPVGRVAGWVSEPDSLKALRFSIEGTTLLIERADPGSKERVSIAIASPELKSLELSGDAVFTANDLDAEAFSCSAADSSVVWAKGTSKETRARAQDGGCCMLGGLDSGVLSLEASESGKAAARFSDTASATLSGKSQVLASGSGELWAKLSDDAFLEKSPETRVGSIEVNGKARLSLLVNGEPEVGEVQRHATPTRRGPTRH